MAMGKQYVFVYEYSNWELGELAISCLGRNLPGPCNWTECIAIAHIHYPWSISENYTPTAVRPLRWHLPSSVINFLKL